VRQRFALELSVSPMRAAYRDLRAAQSTLMHRATRP
jgi:hypothetical protein